MLIADAASENSLLPIHRMVSICGEGQILNNEYTAALMDCDATLEGMRAIVSGMFSDPKYADDQASIARRYESALQPAAWEAVASARFCRPGHQSSGSGEVNNDRIHVPTLLMEGDHDKLKPAGWVQRLADRLPNGAASVMEGSGHCPQVEQPERFLQAIDEFFTRSSTDGE